MDPVTEEEDIQTLPPSAIQGIAPAGPSPFANAYASFQAPPTRGLGLGEGTFQTNPRGFPGMMGQMGPGGLPLTRTQTGPPGNRQIFSALPGHPQQQAQAQPGYGQAPNNPDPSKQKDIQGLEQAVSKVESDETLSDFQKKGAIDNLLGQMNQKDPLHQYRKESGISPLTPADKFVADRVKNMPDLGYAVALKANGDPVFHKLESPNDAAHQRLLDAQQKREELQAANQQKMQELQQANLQAERERAAKHRVEVFKAMAEHLAEPTAEGKPGKNIDPNKVHDAVDEFLRREHTARQSHEEDRLPGEAYTKDDQGNRSAENEADVKFNGDLRTAAVRAQKAGRPEHLEALKALYQFRQLPKGLRTDADYQKATEAWKIAQHYMPGQKSPQQTEERPSQGGFPAPEKADRPATSEELAHIQRIKHDFPNDWRDILKKRGLVVVD